MIQFHDVCIKLKDKNEIAIIRKYGWNARLIIVLVGKMT